MNDLRSVLAEVAVALRSQDCAWALMGGLAVSTYVEPRFTRDVDLAVAVADDGEAERLARDDRRRPQDLLDLRALLAQLEPAEHERARTALALIQARGYDRGRELVEELDRLLAAG